MNQYLATLDYARYARAQRRGQTWYKNPFRWLDMEDMAAGYKQAKRNARAFLDSLLVKRPTEYTALVRLCIRAFNGYDFERLTNRQALAVLYAREAKECGLTATTHVAHKLGINRHSAWKLLNRADKAHEPILETSRGDYQLDSNGAIIVMPDNRTIRAVAASLKRVCATCNDMTPDGTKALCWKCHKQFRLDREFKAPWTEADVEQYIRYANRAHWQEAKAQVEQDISYEQVAEAALPLAG